MSKIAQLRNELNALVESQTALVEGDFGSEDQAKFEAMNLDIDAKRKHIDAIEAVAKQSTVKSSIADSIESGIVSDKTEAGVKAFAKFLVNGDKAMNAADWDSLRNAQVTTTSSAGGITVPTTTMSYVTEALKAFGGLRAVANVISTASGETMVFPTHDATAEVGEIVAEGATTNALDTTLGSVSSAVYQYSSKTMEISRQLMTDSAVDIVSMVMATLVSRIARITNSHFATGTGTGQPQGVVAASATGVTVANAAAVNYAALLDLFHSLDVAYRQNGVWLMNDSTVKLIRKLLDAQNRPLFLGDDMGANNAWDAGTLFNRPVVICNDLPSTGAGNKPILFGDFSKYIIRDVNSFGVEVYTDSVYARKHTVGYNGWMRSGAVNTGINNIFALVTTA
jgi:HK97 family phage major capsid protein